MTGLRSVQAQPGPLIINGGVIQNFNGFNVQFGNQNTPPQRMPEPRGDVLEFVDGSALHGSLAKMDVDHGLTWTKPEANSPITFRPNHLDYIRFAHASSVAMTPSCHLWFENGDDLYGSVTSLDDEHVGFKTWFGGEMSIPRKAVRALTFLSRDYSVAYEGPYDLGGWLVVNNKSWTFHDGAFVGSGPGTLGRDLGLTNSATMEFDLSWSSAFTLEVGIYCDVMDRLEPNGGSCVLNLSPKQVSLRQIQNMGIFNQAGVPVPEGEAKGRMHVAIECDKDEGTVSVFIDHALAKTWKDCNFAGGGTGVLFMQSGLYMVTGLSSPTLKISHLKVSQWVGRGEPEASEVLTNGDAIHFINHDQTKGKIQSVQDGKVRLALGERVLTIPLERVTQIAFAEPTAIAETPNPWEVRAHFPGGGSVSFQLEKWDDKTVTGRSAIFGTLAFQPGAIRELEFNLNRTKEEGLAAATKDFEELDE